MLCSSKIKILKNIFSFSFVILSFYNLSSYADTINTVSVDKLIAGYGEIAIKANALNTAPVNDSLTIAINNAQAAYLLSGGAPLTTSLTQQLLIESANLNDKNNNILTFLWDPTIKINPNLEKNPLNSIDINSLLQPISYSDTESAAAKNVINALSGSLMPINTINFNQQIANLSGNKENNLKAELQKKQIQAYLASLRSYLATQTVALSNLYQLYSERQPIDPNKADPAVQPALAALKGQISGPISLLKLENIMATRRILDKNWYKNDLINENPATLQRQQVELLAENLAESYQMRMTLERLLATMSVLVLEFNGQVRTQLQTQIQNINNPKWASG